MIAYGVTYRIRGKDRQYEALIDARDARSMKRKLGKKHGYKDGRMIQVIRSVIVGYY